MVPRFLGVHDTSANSGPRLASVVGPVNHLRGDELRHCDESNMSRPSGIRDARLHLEQRALQSCQHPGCDSQTMCRTFDQQNLSNTSNKQKAQVLECCKLHLKTAIYRQKIYILGSTKLKPVDSTAQSSYIDSSETNNPVDLAWQEPACWQELSNATTLQRQCQVKWTLGLNPLCQSWEPCSLQCLFHSKRLNRRQNDSVNRCFQLQLLLCTLTAAQRESWSPGWHELV